MQQSHFMYMSREYQVTWGRVLTRMMPYMGVYMHMQSKELFFSFHHTL